MLGVLFVEDDYRSLPIIRWGGLPIFFINIRWDCRIVLIIPWGGLHNLKEILHCGILPKIKLFFDEEENHVSIIFVIGRKFSFLYQLKLIESNSIRLIFTETDISSTDFFLSV